MSALLDVGTEIKIDHDNVRDLHSRYKAATDKAQKWAIANTLVREMAIHGDAEELSVYKEYPRFGLTADAEHNKGESWCLSASVLGTKSLPQRSTPKSSVSCMTPSQKTSMPPSTIAS